MCNCRKLLAVLVAAALGGLIRGGLAFGYVHESTWFSWWERGFRYLRTGGVGFTGHLDPAILMANRSDTGFCWMASLFPALLGGFFGGAAAATVRPVSAAIVGSILQAAAMTMARLPELYRPGWQLSMWLDYNVPLILEAAVVGMLIGGLGGLIGKLSDWNKSSNAR